MLDEQETFGHHGKTAFDTQDPDYYFEEAQEEELFSQEYYQ
jgi:hypothetical protein